jgi:hypothetical protein
VQSALLGRQYFDGDNIVRQVVPFDVSEVRPLLIIGQVCADPGSHRHHDSLVGEVQPVAASDQLAGLVAGEGVARVRTEVGFAPRSGLHRGRVRKIVSRGIVLIGFR